MALSSFISTLSLWVSLLLLTSLLTLSVFCRLKQLLLPKSKKHVVIAVMGDLGRSPRMQRHGLCAIRSFLNAQDYHVHLLGFINSPLMSELNDDDSDSHSTNLSIHHIRSMRLLGAPFLIYAALRIVSESMSLICVFARLAVIGDLRWIIVQNPPFVPLSIVSLFSARVLSAKMLIDWHNFGYSILALKQGQSSNNSSFTVRLYRGCEKYLGRQADHNLTVTQAMRDFLIKEWSFNGDQITVLYDRPTKQFTTKLKKNSHQKFELDYRLQCILKSECEGYLSLRQKIKSMKNENFLPLMKESNEFWTVTSTSWTPDEDLHSALVNDGVLKKLDRVLSDKHDRIHHDYNQDGLDDNHNHNNNNKTRVTLFVTGKADENVSYNKERFIEEVSKMQLDYVNVYPLWLEDYELYIHLLRQCDVGLCFHQSSSGLDLPMKVVDLFGLGIPVIAVDFDINERKYNALNELVKHEQNGFVFRNSEQLLRYWIMCIDDPLMLDGMRKQVEMQFRLKEEGTFEYQWTQMVLPLLVS